MNVVFGAMTIGKPGTAAILDVFQQHGQSEIDTARIYGQGSSEEYLGNVEWQRRDLRMDTKLYLTDGKSMGYLTPDIYTHKPEDLRDGLKRSLEALTTNKADMYRSISFEVTLCEVDKLRKEGLFDRFGITNYMSWEVAQMCEICEKNRWIKPSVCQNDLYFDALDIIRHAAKKYGLTEAECARRWLVHHSKLKKAHGDAIIIGASSAAQLEQNLALDAAWQHVQGAVPRYFH
ncbi:NADP-dependent oxidoreductase domain-containing protein [Lipomyces starkeyi]